MSAQGARNILQRLALTRRKESDMIGVRSSTNHEPLRSEHVFGFLRWGRVLVLSAVASFWTVFWLRVHGQF